MYNRGQVSDYESWALLGNKGWDFNSLLPYFKKHENFIDPSTYASKNSFPLETTYDARFHGHDGPIQTSFSTWRSSPEDAWIKASTSIGIGIPMDSWSGDHVGIFHGLSTIDRRDGPTDGTRSYATTGYLLPNAHRSNLHVLTDALVSKLVISSDNRTVVGVEFFHSGESHGIEVKKEVILSAGAFKSPQLLELSGIGNPAILTKAGVEPIIKNLQVGENFQDHIGTGLGFELVEGETSLDALQDGATGQALFEEYMTHRTGPISQAGSAHCFVAFTDIATADEIEATQKMILEHKEPGEKEHVKEAKQIIASDLDKPTDGTFHIVMISASLNGSAITNQTDVMKPPAEMLGKQGIWLSPSITRPMSVGSIHITCADPKQDPAIDPAYLTHPADVEMLAKALGLCEKMRTTSPLKEKIKRRYHPHESVDLTTHEERKKFVKEYHGTFYHPLGSVSMGPEGRGACDERLNVRGAKGLRVIDASVMPLHISGNIVSAVYAIAEKGADLIKEDWGL